MKRPIRNPQLPPRPVKPSPYSQRRETIFNFLVAIISHLIVSDKKSKIVPKVRKNLALITKLPEDSPQVTEWIHTICQNVFISYAELFTDLIGGMQAIRRKIEVDQPGLQQIQNELGRGRGVVLAGLHTCGFDHAVCGLNNFLPGIQVLTKQAPSGGSKLMFVLRKLCSVNATPISVSALKEALQRLLNGGVVAVAIDLPVSNGSGYRFFGEDCCLTNAHTRLAVKSGAAIFLVFTRRTPLGKYQIHFQAVPIPTNLGPSQDLVTVWAQRSFRQAEHLILRWPDAWYGTTFDLFPISTAVE